MHRATAKVLSEECGLVDDMDANHLGCIPTLAMLANQKYDLECQLQAIDLQEKQVQEAENFLVTKTIQADQVYKEWDNWVPAMKSEFQSLVHEKRAVRQISRDQAKAMAKERGIIYEELPSKVVFTRKAGGKYKVRACVCGNFEGPVTAATYAGGCDAAQIRCTVRHGALKKWSLYGTDIKCAFLNAPRQDQSKLVTMTVPSIYVRLGMAAAGEVWVIDSAVYGLMTSPRDWADHRDLILPTIKWCLEETKSGTDVEVKDDGEGWTCQFDRCYQKSPDSGTSTQGPIKTWHGSFVATSDQHLWHLQEVCAETGEKRQCGIMAIYVDDVLMTAAEATAEAALAAISKVWECSPVEKATCEKAVTFCGFELQANEPEYGGGFRLHQQNYEEELLQKWGVTTMARQMNVKLPTPEEESQMSKSDDIEAVRQGQAITGALLWLATRTRPEITVAVSAMSRLCTKDPKATLEIGKKIMEYLKKPTRGMIYGETVGPIHGARNQLQKQRCEQTVEAYSDISYASTSGYRSVQGQVYYYAGAPIMWSTSRQPFPTQSTAESELVALCEALVGGRATTALVAAIRDEEESQLKKWLWGDNAAAICLATGEGQGSWRTRHLRIRAAILKSALHQGEWDLSHLSGRELVADSFTKIVDGAAFERALQDLGISIEQRTKIPEINSGSGVTTAKLALLIGSSLVSGAAASEETFADEETLGIWLCGIILMCVGAIYVGDKVVRSAACLWKRLQGTSGSHDNPVFEERQSRQGCPEVRALRVSEDESWEVCSGASQEEEVGRRSQPSDPQGAEPVAMSGLHEMLQQSRAAQQEPYNKIHGRVPSPWVDDEGDEDATHLVDRALPDQLPRRRKKKGKGNRKERDEVAEAESAMRNLLSSVGNLFGRSASMNTISQTRQSGTTSSGPLPQSGTAASSTSALRSLPQSGSAAASASSLNPLPRSGSAAASASSSNPLPRSGIAAASASSLNPLPQSGIAAASASSLNPLPQSGTAEGSNQMSQHAGYPSGSPSILKSKPKASSGQQPSSSDSQRDSLQRAGSEAAASEAPRPVNQWNAFQHAHRNKHWGTERMRAEYWKYKATGHMPWASRYFFLLRKKGGVQRVWDSPAFWAMIKCISVLSDAQLWHVRHFCVKKRSEWILICEKHINHLS